MSDSIYEKKMKGRFQPKNPNKYLGNPTNIVWRSTWELHFMQFLDSNDEIVGWGSEELVIPYRSPLDGKIHRYYPDMVIKKKNNEVIIVEIKPFAECSPPAMPKTKTRRYLTEAATYLVNQAKWKAAAEYAADRKWKFQVITEKELYGK